MSVTVKATWQDGVFKPKEPVNLPEHTEVDVVLPSVTAEVDGDDSTGWKAAWFSANQRKVAAIAAGTR